MDDNVLAIVHHLAAHGGYDTCIEDDPEPFGMPAATMYAAIAAGLVKYSFPGSWSVFDGYKLTKKGWHAIGATPPASIWVKLGTWWRGHKTRQADFMR